MFYIISIIYLFTIIYMVINLIYLLNEIKFNISHLYIYQILHTILYHYF